MPLMIRKIGAIFKLLRPKQWLKNGFVLAPVLFSGLFVNLTALASAIMMLLVFCLSASMVYVLNDLVDVEADRQHPKKRLTRPIASGEISKKQAYGLLLVQGLFLLILSVLAFEFMWPVLTYVLLNIGYSFNLKKIPFLDILTIALGFVLRVLAGAVVISVPLSLWMLVTTFSVALFLAGVKRLQELKHSNAEYTRGVLKFYNPKLLAIFCHGMAITTLLCYVLFVWFNNPTLRITAPLVGFGLFRYWQLYQHNQQGESPTEVLLEDKILLSTVFIWFCVSVLVLMSPY